MYSFSAGALCLDFANTCGDRPNCAEENLTCVDDLLDWGAQAGLLAGTELARFDRRSETSSAALSVAIGLREAIYAACSAVAASRAPSKRDLATINSVLRKALPNLELGIRANGCCWEWSAAATVSDRILWPIARSAADLLTSDSVSRLRECAGEGCSWLFLDSSRNGRRKWCSMSGCGNRAKARRHYARCRSIS
jgi:predicted RNA-binding Zn ribbon-like protein